MGFDAAVLSRLVYISQFNIENVLCDDIVGFACYTKVITLEQIQTL